MATVEKNSRRLLDVSCSDVVCILGCCFVLVVNALTDATVAVIIAMRKETILKYCLLGVLQMRVCIINQVLLGETVGFRFT